MWNGFSEPFFISHQYHQHTTTHSHYHINEWTSPSKPKQLILVIVFAGAVVIAFVDVVFFFAFDGCYCDNLFVLLPFEWHCPIASLLFAIFPLYHIMCFVQRILLVHAFSSHWTHYKDNSEYQRQWWGRTMWQCGCMWMCCVVMLCCLFVLSKSLVFNVVAVVGYLLLLPPYIAIIACLCFLSTGSIVIILFFIYIYIWQINFPLDLIIYWHNLSIWEGIHCQWGWDNTTAMQALQIDGNFQMYLNIERERGTERERERDPKIW